MAIKKNKSSLVLKSLEKQFINTGDDHWTDDWWDDFGAWWPNYDYDWWNDEVYHRNKKIEEILGPDLRTTLRDFTNGNRKK